MNDDLCFCCCNNVSTEAPESRTVKVVTVRDKLSDFKDLCECLRLLLLEKETNSYNKQPQLTLLNFIYLGLCEIDEDLKKV